MDHGRRRNPPLVRGRYKIHRQNNHPGMLSVDTTSDSYLFYYYSISHATVEKISDWRCETLLSFRRKFFYSRKKEFFFFSFICCTLIFYKNILFFFFFFYKIFIVILKKELFLFLCPCNCVVRKTVSNQILKFCWIVIYVQEKLYTRIFTSYELITRIDEVLQK